MQYTIGFGLGFTKAGKAIDATMRQEAIKLILTQASLKFGGCNLTFGQGAWINGAGDLVVEESAVLTIQALANGRLEGDVDKNVRDLARVVQVVLEQEAVIIGKQVATATMLV